MQFFSEKFLGRILLGLFLFDVFLVLWVFLLPDSWFMLFHGAEYIDPQALLKRCGANWAAFAILQFCAFLKWKKAPEWLAIVAGVRLSDIFTDLTCMLLANNITWVGILGFGLMFPINLFLGIYFLRAFRQKQLLVSRKSEQL